MAQSPVSALAASESALIESTGVQPRRGHLTASIFGGTTEIQKEIIGRGLGL